VVQMRLVDGHDLLSPGSLNGEAETEVGPEGGSVRGLHTETTPGR
jgi:hypothetical protein